MHKLNAAIFVVLFTIFGSQATSGKSIVPYQYVSPVPDAVLVSAETTLTVRPGPALQQESISDSLFVVEGEASGRHTGTAILADDDRTVIFRPDGNFVPEETVSISIRKGLLSSTGEAIVPASFSFTISPKTTLTASALSNSPQSAPLAEEALLASDVGLSTNNGIPRTYETLDVTFPPITSTISSDLVDDGYLFLAPFQQIRSLLILDNNGEPVYFSPSDSFITDFKVQPNGLLTYTDWDTNHYDVMDNSYTVVDTVRAGNGYNIDFHDLQLLPNGHALFMIYDERPVDMSEIVAGGVSTATVIALVIQELDVDKNVVFEWRSWDHIPITDTYISLPGRSRIDYVHGNAVEADTDGNILVSSRNLSEVTKINRQTGEIMWRLGGKQNEFTFIGDSDNGFVYQHDIRRLANGNISLFDNREDLEDGSVPYSRIVEYRLDEENKIAELVRQYRTAPDTFGAVMGNAQPLPTTNTLIGWGSADQPNLTEVTRDGAKAFEMDLGGMFSYRYFRFPWKGVPTSQPTLVAKAAAGSFTLHYSWNGATEIASYRIYGGESAPTVLIAEQDKAGFETKTEIDAAVAQQYCVWQVIPVDTEGNEARPSNVALNRNGPCVRNHFPQIWAD